MSLLVNYDNSDDSGNDEDDDNTLLNSNENKINLKHEHVNHDYNKNQYNKKSDLIKDNISDIEFENSPTRNNNVHLENKIDVSFVDIFSKLPAPSVDAIIIEPEMIILPSKSEIDLREKPPEKKKIIINLPNIADSDSDSENENGPCTKKKRKGGKCDLFNLLPAPKSSATKELNRTLVPHSVFAKQKISSISIKNKSFEPEDSISGKNPSVGDLNDSIQTNFKSSNELAINSIKSTSTALLADCYSDSDNEESGANYFSIDNKTDSDCLVQNSNYIDNFKSNLSSDLLVFNDTTNTLLTKTSSQSILTDFPSSLDSNFIGPIMGPSNLSQYDDTNTNKFPEQMYLSSEYIDTHSEKTHLEAPRSRDFADFESAEIIEARIDDWMSGYEVQKVKDLTQEHSRISYSKKHNKDMPTMQQKRKHQITYLAYEAKERELELKNQWAENRFTKKQTQSKYGF